jgi:beta-phosphoglucomutase-like phosphatase (HAD superfamily)
MKGLIFDVDGILGDTEGLSVIATTKMFKELYNLDVQPEDYLPYIGTGAELYCIGPGKKYGVDIDVVLAVETRHKYFLELLVEDPDISFPGIHALIQAAHDAPDWKLGIATSSPGKKSAQTLKSARVNTDLFDVWIHGDMIAKKKPDPEIYLRAAKDLGLDPSVCVAVEDSIQGVDSARDAGMKVLAVTNSFTAEELHKADRIVSSLEGVTLESVAELLGNG